MNRVDTERDYWNRAATDPQVDVKYIADVDTEECLTKAIRPHLKYGITLDLGCGVGRLTIPIAKDTDSFIYGVDISERMLHIAVERALRADIRNISLLMNDGRSLPFDDNFFDCAYSMLLFQHIPAEAVKAYITEVSRVLKPNGVFRFQFIEGDEDEPFSKHYSKADIVQWLGDAKMSVETYDKGLIHEQWSWMTVKKGQ